MQHRRRWSAELSAAPVPPPNPPLPGWAERHAALAALAQRQLFFIGACPRSGTTWLQMLLDAHPQVSCRGEGHYPDSFGPKLHKAATEHNALLERKNRTILAEIGGYPKIEAPDLVHLLTTAILLGIDRQLQARPDRGAPCRAVGEKTPDNVRWFTDLRQAFPQAKFIHLVRDPRDILVSAWFHNLRLNPDWPTKHELQSFVRDNLKLVEQDVRLGERFGAAFPANYLCVSYETLTDAPDATALRLFYFLGVDATAGLAAGCVAAARFERLSGGRARGEAAAGSHFRRGVVGGWRDLLSPETNRYIVEHAGWMLARYGWPHS